MAKTLSKSGIFNGHDVDAWHVSQSVDAFTKVEAYDITVSGSFTVTGSLKVRGTVFGRTSQSSSLAITSSYALYSPTVISASRADYNSSNQYTLQFYSPSSDPGLLNNNDYGIGAGEAIIPHTGIYGITLPVDSQTNKYKIIVVSTCKSVGTMTSQLQLMSGASTVEYTFTNVIQYKNPYNSFEEEPTDIIFPAGTRLWFRINTLDGTTPSYVAHNIILTLQPL
jgi:hypothetical protein